MLVQRKLPMMIMNAILGIRIDFLLCLICLSASMFFFSCDPNPNASGPIEVDGPAGPTDPTETEAEEEIPRPAGWGEETHSKGATPNYDVVFDDDLDVTLVHSGDLESQRDLLVVLADVDARREVMVATTDTSLVAKERVHHPVHFPVDAAGAEN